ncbi:DUF4131 domain-containing protein [Bacteroidia bacterium]|nr:DUF4131 domain-containing protein [Bacteroidia bacterium]MDB9883196.1 DUF4131 domain-containing protein [Bacteroidia bacterium]
MVLPYLIILSFIVWGSYRLKKKVNLRLQQALSISTLVLVLVSGMLLTQAYRSINYDGHFVNDNKGQFVLTRVVSNPEKKKNSIGCQISLLEIRESSNFRPVKGLAQIYLENDSLSKNVRYGDYLILENELKEISEAKILINSILKTITTIRTYTYRDISSQVLG